MIEMPQSQLHLKGERDRKVEDCEEIEVNISLFEIGSNLTRCKRLSFIDCV